jgi:hypothetical protein
LIRGCGYHFDRRIRSANFSNQLHPLHGARHIEVGQNQRDIFAIPEDSQRIARIAGFDDRESLVAKKIANGEPNQNFIFDNEKSGIAAGNNFGWNHTDFPLSRSNANPFDFVPGSLALSAAAGAYRPVLIRVHKRLINRWVF